MIISRKRFEREKREAVEREMNARLKFEDDERRFNNLWNTITGLERRIEHLERIADIRSVDVSNQKVTRKTECVF